MEELDRPYKDLSDEEVLALAHLKLSDEFGRRNSELLNRQQEGILTEAERIELAQQMEGYQMALLKKAQGAHEAFVRGLILDL